MSNTKQCDDQSVFFLNGLYQNKETWNPIIAELSGCSVINFDLPNQVPETFDVEYSHFNQYLSYVQKTFEQINVPIEDCIAVGLSSGSNMLRHLHCEYGYNFKALVLLSPNPGGLDVFYDQYVQSLLNCLDSGGLKAFSDAAMYVNFPPMFFQKIPHLRTMISSQYERTYAGNMDCLRSLLNAALSDPNLANPPSNFNTETHILVGQSDYLIPSSALEVYKQRCVGNVYFKNMDGGHSFPLEAPSPTSRYIQSIVNHHKNVRGCSKLNDNQSVIKSGVVFVKQ